MARVLRKKWGGSGCSKAVGAAVSHQPHLNFHSLDKSDDKNSLPVWSKHYRITHSVLNRIPETGLVLTDQWRSDLIAPSPDLQAEWVHLSNISSHTQKHRWLWWRQQWICNTVLTALCIWELCIKSVCVQWAKVWGLKGVGFEGVGVWEWPSGGGEAL